MPAYSPWILLLVLYLPGSNCFAQEEGQSPQNQEDWGIAVQQYYEQREWEAGFNYADSIFRDYPKTARNIFQINPDFYYWAGRLAYNYQERYKVLTWLPLAIQAYEAQHKTEENNFILSHYYYGLNLKLDEQFVEAIRIFKRGGELKKDQLGKSYYYHQLTSCYISIEDFDNALHYANLAFHIRKVEEGVSDRLIANAIHMLGVLHYEMDEDSLALGYFLEELTARNQMDPSKISNQIELGDNLNDLGAAHDALGHLDSAQYYYKKALTYRSNPDLYGPDELNYGQTLYSLGLVYVKQKAFQQARDLYNSALPIVEGNRMSTAKVLQGLGALEHEIGINPERAQQYFFNALSTLLAADKQFSIDHLPEAEDLEKFPFALEIIQSLSKSLQNTHPEAGLAWLKQGLKAADYIRYGYSGHLAKLEVGEAVSGLCDIGMGIVYQLYEAKKDPAYINLAFEYSERARANLLLESLLKGENRSIFTENDGLLSKEQSLRFKIDSLQYRQEYEESDSIIIALGTSILQYQSQIDSIRKMIRTEAPNYYAIKFGGDRLQLSEIKPKLRKGEAFIEYFWGEKYSYAFVVTSTFTNLIELGSVKSLTPKLVGFRKLLDHPPAYTAQSQQLQTYITTSNQVYQSILEPLFAITDQNINKVIISPHGVLGYIPFGTLVNPLSARKARHFSALPYLAKELIFTYIYSANLFFQQEQGKGTDISNCLGIAFSTPDQKGLSLLGMNELPNSYREVEQVVQSYGGVFLFDSTASEAKFKALASNSDMIYLALHGIADAKNPERSYLQFKTPGSPSEDGRLYPYEIYALNLKAKLVILSACESGLGKEIAGEGIWSLARAFSMAGAKRVISTQWQVDDDVISQALKPWLVNHPKPLKNVNFDHGKKAHPFYWGAIIDTRTNQEPLSGFRFVFLVLFAALGIIGIILIQKIR